MSTICGDRKGWPYLDNRILCVCSGSGLFIQRTKKASGSIRCPCTRHTVDQKQLTLLHSICLSRVQHYPTVWESSFGFSGKGGYLAAFLNVLHIVVPTAHLLIAAPFYVNLTKKHSIAASSEAFAKKMTFSHVLSTSQLVYTTFTSKCPTKLIMNSTRRANSQHKSKISFFVLKKRKVSGEVLRLWDCNPSRNTPSQNLSFFGALLASVPRRPSSSKCKK